MFNYIRNFFFNAKEYIITIILLLVSLVVISQNDKSEIKRFKTISFAAVAFLKSSLSSASDFLKDDEELQNQKKINAKLMLEVNNLRNYKKENEELKTLLNFKKSIPKDLIPAEIVSKKITMPRWNFIINSGKNDGVKEGMPVLTETGLVGIVYSCSGSFSVVRTLRNVDLNIAVTNQRSLVNGVLNWNGKNLIIKNIPSTYDMELGDRIVTSDFSTLIPPSIPVGLIVKKETDQSGLVSNVIVSTFADLSRAQNVFVYPFIRSKEIDSLEFNLMIKRDDK
ncbi:MAG: rod shape-determining protein MreC [Ignavibacteria bacterium]|nr:rod shape-determining protein MreC [Ignavibacteria bacterium]